MVSSTGRLFPLRLRLALASIVAVCLAAPAADAEAATRYASPSGTGTAPCAQSAPCSLEDALSNAEGLANGDTVLLAPGTYHPAGELSVFRSHVTVSGEAGGAMPVIEAAGERGLFFQNPGTVRDLRIDVTSATTYGLTLIGSESVAERVESTGEASNTACAFNHVTARDVLCATSATSGSGVLLSISAPAPVTDESKLLNVTAIGGFAGLWAGANEEATVKVSATNTILRGGEHDIVANSALVTSPVEVQLSHSNFADAAIEGPSSTVTAPTEAANQSAAPVFVDAVAGDYREQSTSPTRLAGDLGVLVPGELDLAGEARTTNCEGTIGVDIGAYQYECPTPSTGGSGSGGGSVVEIKSPAATAPKLTKLSLKPKRFVTTGKKKGTTISFTLSAAATVKIEVLGKRSRKGKKATVSLGALPVVHGKVGVNKVKFTGKVKSKPLAPGSYTLRVVASASGLTSAAQTRAFKVLAGS